MERLTSYDGNYYYPHCMKGSTCDGHGSSEKCNECEFNERVCVTLGKYEDTGLTPEQIMELKERDTAKGPEPAPMGMDGMVCPSCGKKALPWDRFCGECGQRFWEDE